MNKKITQKMVEQYTRLNLVYTEKWSWANDILCQANDFLQFMRNHGYDMDTKKEYRRSLWIVSNKILNGSKEYIVDYY